MRLKYLQFSLLNTMRLIFLWSFMWKSSGTLALMQFRIGSLWVCTQSRPSSDMNTGKEIRSQDSRFRFFLSPKKFPCSSEDFFISASLFLVAFLSTREKNFSRVPTRNRKKVSNNKTKFLFFLSLSPENLIPVCLLFPFSNWFPFPP